MATMKKPAKKMQMGGTKMMMKKGGSFDLNKDGKTTFKDVLIGRGVLPKTAKKGTKVKKYQNSGEPLAKKSKNPYVVGSRKKLEKVKSEGNPNNPPLKNEVYTRSLSGPKLKYSVSTDTSGLAAGKKEFPSVTTNVKTGNKTEGIAGRKAVEYRMKNPKSTIMHKRGGSVKKTMKTGGKMAKKCKYGCK